MQTTRRFPIGGREILATLLVLPLLMTLGTSLATAQENTGEQARERHELRDPPNEPQGEALRERIRERIQNEPGLQAQERERLQKHLGECSALGLDDDTVEALFNEEEPLRAQLRQQERVLTMARQGLPIEPVMNKLQEGRRKGANEEALERVCSRMEEHVRTASRIMERAHADGVEPAGDPRTERQLTRSMAMNMWRGLAEGDMDQLRERARARLREHQCTTTDLAAAAETATQLKEMNTERHRAVEIAGQALQRGYSAREMRQISWMVMAAHAHGGPPEEVLGRIEQGLRNQERMGEMVQNMWQRGWMGPGDEHGGRGGHSPVDDVIGGPGGQGGDGQQGSGGGQGGGPGGGEGGGPGGGNG
jgi:hypothetical protein